MENTTVQSEYDFKDRLAKAATLVLILALGFIFRFGLIELIGTPSIGLGVFWLSTLGFVLFSVGLTVLAVKIRGLWGYLVDVVYGLLFAAQTIVVSGMKSFEGWGGYSLQSFLWIAVMAVCLVIYLDYRHPRQPGVHQATPAANRD